MDRDTILTSLRERIVAFATLRVSRDHAEDLAQDVLVLLHDKYSHVVELTELVPLAFQVLRYKMLDAHRKALRRGEYNQESVENLDVAASGGTPEAQLDQKQRVERLVAALSRLGERCRELFRWKLEGKSFPEIQRLMGQKSVNTIYTWDLRCRKQLLSLMGGSWE
ncbi:MAG TPA: sigma-70 family RNA polymerase sigma factor [Nitrospira sp.]|nr:sigma-70 family RNA polymerase sigma factor [Nitrospira sp.]